MGPKTIERYSFLALLIGTLSLTFLIFRPFWVILILGVSFAVVLHPLYKWFQVKKFPDWLAAFVTVLLFVVLLCGPLLTIGTMVFNQSQSAYSRIVNVGQTVPIFEKIDHRVNSLLPLGVVFSSEQKTRDLFSYITKNLSDIFTATVSAFLSFALMLVIIYYFLKEGSVFKQEVLKLSPLGHENDEKIISRLTVSINGVIKGSLFIAFIQGLLMGFGLWFFNVPNPALFGVVTAIASLIPTLGTSLISIPIILFLLLTGKTAAALGLLVWSIIMVGMIDNVLGPIIVGKRVDVPSILILFSVLGGVSLMGPVGVIMGPLTISLLYALSTIYKSEFNENASL